MITAAKSVLTMVCVNIMLRLSLYRTTLHYLAETIAVRSFLVRSFASIVNHSFADSIHHHPTSNDRIGRVKEKDACGNCCTRTLIAVC